MTSRADLIEAMARAWCAQYIREEHQLVGHPVREDDLAVNVEIGWGEFKAAASVALDALGKLAAVVPRSVCDVQLRGIPDGLGIDRTYEAMVTAVDLTAHQDAEKRG